MNLAKYCDDQLDILSHEQENGGTGSSHSKMDIMDTTPNGNNFTSTAVLGSKKKYHLDNSTRQVGPETKGLIRAY